MGVAVDKAWRDHKSVGIYGLCRAIVDTADFDDAPVLDPDVGAVTRHTGTIDHCAVLDQ
jgi:hypothetical protein